ncbi:MAG TPA: dihydrodipicolinate synthase family protein [Limnochordales bacterium]
MSEPRLQGVFPYLVSPIDADGSVKEATLRRLVRHLIDQGVHGLTPLGSTGEVAYLSREQRREIVRIVVEEAAGRVPVVAGVESVSTAGAIEESLAYRELGADGIVLILSSYFPLREADVVRYFKEVAAALDCPVIVYNNPRFTGVDLSVGVLEQLAAVDNIRYLKDATGNTGKLLSVTNRLGGRLEVFAASAHIPLFVMMLGGVGWMAGPACVIPRQCVQLYELCRAGRWEEALALQRKLWPVNELFQKYLLAAAVKAALELQGFDVGEPLAPQPRLDAAAREEIARVLRDVGALQ